MAWKSRGFALVLSLLARIAASQEQAILQQGNGQLPSCAQSCQKLIQASQACSGTTSASQTAWICFCQSGYLTSLRQSAAAVCPTECTSQSDLQKISSWYSSNCGSDNGASEHQGGGGGGATSAAGGGNAAASSTGAASPSSSSGSDSSDSSDGTSSASDSHQDWWSGHYQWIVMVVLLAILLPAVGVLGHWLKRRHERRQDQPREGFNAGITSRPGPMSNPDANMSGAVGSVHMDNSGTASPARTRDAFMPYGYAYSRSESGLDSRQATRNGGRNHRDVEKEAASAPGSKRNSRRVLVRERTGESYEPEKSTRF